MQSRCFIACLLVLICFGVHRRAISQELPAWFDSGRCGTNALYGMLRLSGLSLQYHEVANKVQTTDQGTSIRELELRAIEFGLDAEVRQVSVTELADLPCPFLMHFNGNETGGTGHFILVTDCGRDIELPSNRPITYINYIDGGDCLAYVTEADAVRNEGLFSGYVLAAKGAKRNVTTWTSLAFWPAVGAICLGLASFIIFYRPAQG